MPFVNSLSDIIIADAPSIIGVSTAFLDGEQDLLVLASSLRIISLCTLFVSSSGSWTSLCNVLLLFVNDVFGDDSAEGTPEDPFSSGEVVERKKDGIRFVRRSYIKSGRERRGSKSDSCERNLASGKQ